MTPEMNCFDWLNQVSDHLDGTLKGGARTEADLHLTDCRECTERLRRYRQVLTSIANQPRSTLPIPIRKSPLTAAMPRVETSFLSRGRWERLPWYVRTAIEGFSMVIVVVLAISAVPRIRTIYEKRLERNIGDLGDLNGGFNPAETTDASGGATTARLARGKPADAEADEDDFGSEGEDVSQKAVRVGNSEIWRFSLKTDSPYEIRTKVVSILTSLRVPSDTRGIGGIEAPGGIQFDILVNRAIVASLKTQLERLARAPETSSASGDPTGEPFTWYRNESKRKIPEGKTRVVIWLSQM